jgi:hypothetical protein
MSRELPPVGQHGLDFWTHEIACPACDNHDRHPLRLIDAVDILFCSKCWTKIELAKHKAAIAADVSTANEIGLRT